MEHSGALYACKESRYIGYIQVVWDIELKYPTQMDEALLCYKWMVLDHQVVWRASEVL